MEASRGMKEQRQLGALLEAFVNRISHPRGRALTLMLEASLTTPQVILLNFALTHPDSTPSDLAFAMNISASSASQMIERLVKLGFARRTEDSEDRRRKAVTVTAKGTTFLTRLKEVRSAEYAVGTEALSRETRRCVIEVLSQAMRELMPQTK